MYCQRLFSKKSYMFQLQRGVAPSYHPGPASFTPAVNPNYHPPLPSAYGPTAVGPTVRHNPVPAAQINQFH